MQDVGQRTPVLVWFPILLGTQISNYPLAYCLQHRLANWIAHSTAQTVVPVEHLSWTCRSNDGAAGCLQCVGRTYKAACRVALTAVPVRGAELKSSEESAYAQRPLVTEVTTDS